MSLTKRWKKKTTNRTWNYPKIFFILFEKKPLEMCNCTRQKHKNTTSAMQSTEIIEWSHESQANARQSHGDQQYQQQIFMEKNYVVYQIRRTRLCNAKAKHQNERTNEEKREHHPCDGWLVVAAATVDVVAVFFVFFLICHLFVVKTVHSAKLRAFYGARRYFPLQFHYFRVCLFRCRTKRRNDRERCRTVARNTHIRVDRPVEWERATALADRHQPTGRRRKWQKQKYDFHRRLNELFDFCRIFCQHGFLRPNKMRLRNHFRNFPSANCRDAIA